MSEVQDLIAEDDKAEQQLVRRGISASVEKHLRDYFSAYDGLMPPSGFYALFLEQVERPLIELSLKHCRGNQIRTAEMLGINRNTLRKKIKELGITTGRKGA